MDDMTGKVKICVIACQEERSEKDSVAGLLDRMKDMTDERGMEYLEILKNEYLHKNYSHFGILSLIEDMKREAGS